MSSNKQESTDVATTSPHDWLGELPQAFRHYCGNRRIDEVECIIPDMIGTSRGKAMPFYKFAPTITSSLPLSLFYQTVTGGWVDMDIADQWVEPDMVLRPDMSTASAVPWADDTTLQVINDLETRNGLPVPIAPRNILKNVIAAYHKQGWNPVLAPELEFYVIKKNTDPNEPIEPSICRTGRRGTSRQAYSMVAVDDHGPVIDTIFEYAEAQGLAIDTVIQEGGAGQIEINLLHGDPLLLADRVFYFKRAIREAALKNGVFATFMAKPMRDEPGSAMHVHQSVLWRETGMNVFSNSDGSPSDAFYAYIAGSQRYLAELMPMFAPYANSFRRFQAGMAAPTNIEWAHDNRTTGFRIPCSDPQSRRVENRVIGVDSNPYIAFAATLACGYLGMIKHLKPREEVRGEINNINEIGAALPASLGESLDLFDSASEVRKVIGEEFCNIYGAIKREELNEFQREISPWEREHLLLNV